mgnify:CR=1 FL=1
MSASAVEARPPRPVVTELRLAAFRGHRGTVLPLGPLTLLAGPSGSGKSTALEALARLGRLCAGEPLPEVFPDPVACVPQQARPDAQGRRGFRLGCTVDGPVGPVRLDVAVQAEPRLRIVGERLTGAGHTLLATGLREPRRPVVHAEWFTGGAARVVRAPLPDDRLGTALLPLRIAGTTDGERLVVEAAEQLLVALRAVFHCDPQPAAMRAPAAATDGLLRGRCDNLAAVLRRTRTECTTRHAALVAAVRNGCAGPVVDLLAEECAPGRVRAVVERGDGARTPVGWLGDGELRFMALALVLLTGPGVLETDRVEEVLAARQALAVLVDGLDRGMDARQAEALRELAVRMCARGHIRLLATVGDAASACGGEGVRVVELPARWSARRGRAGCAPPGERRLSTPGICHSQ